jgi:hypothetical protein
MAFGHRPAGVVDPIVKDGELCCILGVANIGSLSSGSMGSKSSSLLESSEPNMLMFPAELVPVLLSPKRGESINMELMDCLREPIMAR